MTSNFNRMHSFLRQASTDPHHPLNHEKHSLCIVTNVAWRPVSCRQAVHQFWKIPRFLLHPMLDHFFHLYEYTQNYSQHNHNNLFYTFIDHQFLCPIHSNTFQFMVSDNIHSTLTHIHCSIHLSLRLGGYTYCWSTLSLYKNHHYLFARSDFTQNSRKPKNESKYLAPPGGSTSPARLLISKPRK